MPQKKRLELKPDHKLKTKKFYSTKTFVFVLDLQIFYENGSILKVVFPSGGPRYIPLTTSFETFKVGRSMGLGYLEGHNFYWVDFYPNPVLSICFAWVEVFTRRLKVPLYLFCLLFYFDIKKRKKTPKYIFGLFLFYLITFLDKSGWGLPFAKPYHLFFPENSHFLWVCLTTAKDLPLVNLTNLEEAYCETRGVLTDNEKDELIELKKLTEKNIPLARRIKILYWVLQQASKRNISDKFSAQTWGACAELLLYYAQSLRLWIP